ncbi:winged helix-turn-helix transcriptional regulator [Tahibacter amnicola]|uniref:Helix-turn-helix transcriptional regulator n=1 Tax=Tahibacter amnicola TaxID=2976241 RepID=A0ABY6BJB7_9GAMM|nr:helix-turn-helix domain-containing protein [Tahibacter amnicola]UXI69974.1 helix-turn-helix transcriptional regulator [Tahibacter amnicola]
MPLRLRKNRSAPLPPSCPLTECMALIGGAWTPNILWHLEAGPRRFGELRVDIPKVSAKVLSARLRHMAEIGIISRAVIASSPPSVEYSLTDLGEQLLPAIRALVDVGNKLKQRRTNGQGMAISATASTSSARRAR